MHPDEAESSRKLFCIICGSATLVRRARARSSFFFLPHLRIFTTMAPGRTLQKALPAPVSSTSAREGGLPVSPSLNQGKNLKLTILLAENGAHLAGTEVRGWLEVSVSSSSGELYLGEVGIELNGLEGESARSPLVWSSARW